MAVFSASVTCSRACRPPLLGAGAAIGRGQRAHDQPQVADALAEVVKKSIRDVVPEVVKGGIDASVKDAIDAVLPAAVQDAVQAAVSQAVGPAVAAAIGSESFKTSINEALGAKLAERERVPVDYVHTALNQSCNWIVGDVVSKM